MSLAVIQYDYKDGELVKGSVVMDSDKVKILGVNIKQIIGVVNRADRADGLIGGGIKMLIINYNNSEYGMVDMSLEQFEACLSCPPKVECDGVCLDGCYIKLNGCCLTLN